MNNKLIIVIASAIMALPVGTRAQNADTSAPDAPEIQRAQRVRNAMTRYRQGEVLVKFNNDGGVNIKTNARSKKFKSSGVTAIDKVMKNIGVSKAEALMPLSGGKVSAVKSRAYNGAPVNDTDLSQLYVMEYDTAKVHSVDSVVTLLQSMDEVDYAEPNYIYHTQDIKDLFTDPMYIQQTYLQSVNMPQVWKASGTTNVLGHRPVIAILDTGVDITHPDLASNIWTNALEEDGSEDTDDDGNGFKDDIHGWDFVNQSGRIGDWNGHGTHCAGIAAAVSGNGVGIIGANPDALIMPVTVMQSDGTGDVATIIKGIDYAFANGADVISMSIGGYAPSQAQEQALAKAYSKCVLVAAAGNDGYCLNHAGCNITGKPMPCFPAAYNFVLGVQAGDAMGPLSFSNYDDNGPVYTEYSDEKLYNYEIKAPGVAMLSTYPGGRYKRLSGTSMACPLVAGIVSRLIESKEIPSTEVLFGDLIHTSGLLFVDAKAAYDLTDKDRQPTLDLLSFRIDDSKGDGDGRVDAGETIKIYPTLRNAWGQANNIKISVATAENEDPTVVTIDSTDIALGNNLSSYAKGEAVNPLVLTVNKNVVDGRHIKLTIKATCDNISEEMSKDVVLTAENGVELGGTQRENITLYPGVQYIVTRNWGIPKDVVVTVKAGTTIKLHDNVGISNYGYIKFEGTPDSMITITKGDNELGNIGGFLNDNANFVNFNNVIFDNLSNITFNGHTYNHCVIRNCRITSGCLSEAGIFRDCDIYDNTIGHDGLLLSYLSDGASFTECNIHNNEIISSGTAGWGSVARFYHSNYVGNTIISPSVSTPGPEDLDESNCYGNFYDALNGYYSIVYNTTEPEIKYLSEAYLGTSKADIANQSILDETDNVGWGHVDVTKMAKSALVKAPGCVDYITVDDIDPQDEASDMLPIGVGKHKVTVHFNRAMNQSVDPWITMGVRPPYTQKAINEDGTWEDPYTYSAHITIDGKSATDGLNRLRVMDYQQKGSDFQMPDERYRYNIMVQAAGSMSTGMVAEAGLGKVTLTWETMEEDFDDIMGYNMYRFTRNDDGTTSDSVKINQSLIDSDVDQYVDYDVVPGTTYYYYIKEIGTNLTQYDVSKVVAATPLTAQKGDANGSLTVDIADVMSEIAYLSNEDPQPFIFEAADVNSDKEVNILDVVGTLQIITKPDAQVEGLEDEGATAYYYVDNGVLYLETPVALGGVQVNLGAGKDNHVVVASSLTGMEQLSAQLNDKQRVFLAYSMSGKTIAPGVYPLLALDENANAESLVLSTPRGSNVTVLQKDITAIKDVTAKDAKTTNGIYDLNGRRLKNLPKHGIVIVNGRTIRL